MPADQAPQGGVATPALNQAQLYEQVYGLLRTRILRGEFQHGERLCADQLAKDLGISQTPVRAALTRLEGDGLVEILPRRGTFIARFTEKDVREVFQLRRILECASLEHLDRLSEQAIGRMEQIVAESAALVDGLRFRDYPRYVHLDARFHNAIVELLGNDRADHIYEGLRWPVHLILTLSGSRYQRSPDTVAEHAEIVTALKDRNAAAAREAILRHLGNSEADLLRRMGQGEPDR